MNLYTYSDLYEGLSVNFEKKVTDQMMGRFTEISGDINPLHMDEKYAMENGFKKNVVYGMLTASFYSTLVGIYLPGKYCIFQECQNISFMNPVYTGDVLQITGKVKEINNILKRVTIRASIRNQNGEKVSKADLIVGVLK